MSVVARDPSARAGATAVAPPEPREILGRLDRIDVWSLPFLFTCIIAAGFLFAFYDAFDNNCRSFRAASS